MDKPVNLTNGRASVNQAGSLGSSEVNEVLVDLPRCFTLNRTPNSGESLVDILHHVEAVNDDLNRWRLSLNRSAVRFSYGGTHHSS
jgi:hypothetical protein